MSNKLIYIASPYSDPDPNVRSSRWESVCKCAASLMSKGIYVFSPIAHTHPLLVHGDVALPGGWEFWKTYDELLISRHDELWVLQLDGWDNSVGVAAEIECATENEIPIKYICPKTYDISTESLTPPVKGGEAVPSTGLLAILEVDSESC